MHMHKYILASEEARMHTRRLRYIVHTHTHTHALGYKHKIYTDMGKVEHFQAMIEHVMCVLITIVLFCG